MSWLALRRGKGDEARAPGVRSRRQVVLRVFFACFFARFVHHHPRPFVIPYNFRTCGSPTRLSAAQYALASSTLLQRLMWKPLPQRSVNSRRLRS